MWQKIERVDRRVIYILVLLLVSLPLWFPIGLPVPVAKETHDFFDVIDALPADSVVIFSYDYGPASAPELQPMAEAGLFHAKERGLRSVLICFWATGAPLAVNAANLVYETDAIRYDSKYGQDVPGGIVIIGFIPGGLIGMSSFASNVWATIGVDHFGTSFANLPLMNRVQRAGRFGQLGTGEFGVFIDWMSGTPGAIQAILYINGPFGTAIGTGATAVSVPEAMPYYAAGQLFGILGGLAGASEYEALVKTYGWEPTLLAPMDAQSLAHVLVIIFVVIGNIGFAASKLKGG